MNILFYTILFLIGCIIGDVWAEKSCEIPKNLDLRRVNYNNNCNKTEIISKLSYIVIGGISSIIIANTLNLNLEEIDLIKPIIYVFAMIYISALILIAGIDRNYLKIEKNLLAFGIISSLIYMIYLCAIDFACIRLNLIYLAIYMLLLVIDSFMLRKYAKDSYIVNILLLLTMIIAFTDLRVLIYTVAMAVIALILDALFLKLQQKKNGNKKLKISQIPVGYFIAASNIVVLFMIRIFEYYCI